MSDSREFEHLHPLIEGEVWHEHPGGQHWHSASELTPTVPREDIRDRAFGLLDVLRGNARYTDSAERNVNAILGFVDGLGLAATTSGSPEATEPAPLDAAFDADRMTHAWAILEAGVVSHKFPDGTVGVVANPDRWEPDRYNAAAFVKALLATYARLTPAPSASTAPEEADRE